MRAKKSLGQNFLHDDGVIRRIVAALELSEGDTVIEIGPGRGALTGTLLEQAGGVVAIEFDRDLIESLQAMFRNRTNFALICEDALKIDFSAAVMSVPPAVAGGDLSSAPEKSPPATAGGTDLVKLVANLPYNISTPILQRLMDQRALFSRMVLMFQREVVERITAVPGGKERGFLSVLVENAFDTEYLFDVPPEAFQPVPKVWSAVVRLTPKGASTPDHSVFRQVVSASFAQKRKTLLNNLKVRYEDAATILETSDIDGRRRAETLTLDEWIRLTNVISSQ